MTLVNQNRYSQKEIKSIRKGLKKRLTEFFKLLDKVPKPPKEVIRSEFVRHEAEWRLFCSQNGFDARVAELFNANVSLAWEQKYTRALQ